MFTTCISIKLLYFLRSIFLTVAPWNITIKNVHTGVLQGKENQPLVLNCSVNSGIPKESIMWYKGSSLLGKGGPGNYALDIVPNRSDHEAICTCIVNSSALRIPLNQSIKLDIKCKLMYIFIQEYKCIHMYSTFMFVYLVLSLVLMKLDVVLFNSKCCVAQSVVFYVVY